MASEVDICNRALQKLGDERIASLTEDSPQARACNVAYEAVRDAELRAHPWSFAIKRVILAPDADSPEFGYTYQFTLPSDFLRLHPDHEYRLETDWTIEGDKLLTNDGNVLYLRYVRRVTNAGNFDALFVEALASKLAQELCEERTQSNTKYAKAEADYRDAIARARRVNAIEKRSESGPEDDWVSVRYS